MTHDTTPPARDHTTPAMSQKLIIEVQDDTDILTAIDLCRDVVAMGRVSGRKDKKQYCGLAVSKTGYLVMALRNAKSDRLIVRKDTGK